MERSCAVTHRYPDNGKHYEHPETLVYVVPSLNHHTVEPQSSNVHTRHKILVIESAHRTKQRGYHDEIYPNIMLEVDTFFLTAPAQQHKRQHREYYTYPLVNIEPLTKDDQSTDEGHHRTRSIYRTDYRKWQMLYSKIAEQPR